MKLFGTLQTLTIKFVRHRGATRTYFGDIALYFVCFQVGFLLDSGVKTTRPSSTDPRDFLALIDLERYGRLLHVQVQSVLLI